MGLGAPASAQEWPPGPVMVTRKRQAAEGAGDDGGVAAAFEGDGGGDAGAVGAALEEVTHAAEVAFALFAYVGGEEDGDGWGDVGVAEGGGDGEESGEAGGVVADAGGEMRGCRLLRWGRWGCRRGRRCRGGRRGGCRGWC